MRSKMQVQLSVAVDRKNTALESQMYVGPCELDQEKYVA